MKFPSIAHVTEQAQNSFMRFSLPLLLAIAGTVLAIIVAETTSTTPLLSKLLFTIMLCLPLSIGAALFTERLSSKNMRFASMIAVLVFGSFYFIFYAPEYELNDERTAIRFLVLNIILHLWVTVAAYINKKERYGFWKFNEALFIRLVIGSIFSGVLFLGLSLALAAMDVLFKIKIHGSWYFDLWLMIIGVFNTWFFLAGIPGQYQALNEKQKFPKGLKIFTQYILIPLATIYLAILYAYSIKILLQWSLPKGWVSMLILSYAIVGILAILLVYPLRDDTDNAWVRFFTRFFFIALLPLVVLLFIAIGTRVGQYGITEPRYYIIILGGWLAFIACYFIFSHQKNIKIIPISLAIIGALSLFGPWSAFTISNYNQAARFERLLNKYGIKKSGTTMTAANTKMSRKDTEQIQSIIKYFIDRDEVTALKDYYPSNFEEITKHIYTVYKGDDRYSARWNEKQKLNDTLVAILHIDPSSVGIYYGHFRYYSLTDDTPIDIAGFTYLYNFQNRGETGEEKIQISDSNSIVISLDNNKLTLKFKDEITSVVDMSNVIDSLTKYGQSYRIPVGTMTVDGGGKYPTRFIIRNISVEDRDERKWIQSVDGYLLYNWQ